MDKLEPILNLYQAHKKLFKTAVIMILMVAAVVVFGLKGEKQKTLTQFNGESGQTLELPTSSGFEEGQEESHLNGESAKIYVDISGQVKNPGVYEVLTGSRLFEVVEKAGGLLKDADTENINQAEIVSDGQKIVIPSLTDRSGNQDISYTSPNTTFTSDGRVNINTADKDGLQEIPGIGPVTADKIIAYRDTHGRFKTIEDVKNVSGIGEKTFEKIKDMLAV